MYIYGGSALNLPADCCDFSSVPKTIHEDTRHKWAWIWPPGGWSLAVGGLISLAARPEKKKKLRQPMTRERDGQEQSHVSNAYSC